MFHHLTKRRNRRHLRGAVLLRRRREAIVLRQLHLQCAAYVSVCDKVTVLLPQSTTRLELPHERLARGGERRRLRDAGVLQALEDRHIGREVDVILEKYAW